MEAAAQSLGAVDVAEPDLAPTIELIDAPAAVGPRAQDFAVATVQQPSLKRVIDVVLGSTMLVLLAPFMIVLLLAVALDTRATPVFVQVRTGRGGAPFRMLKVRTMYADAEKRLAEVRHLNEVQWPMFKIRNDPRVTRLGRLLRAASLDELPQLINVIKGEMSLVGPRPPLPHEVATYTPEQARRLSVRPGLTGLWQVSGRADCSFEEAVALDLSYIDEHRMVTDLRILLRTLKVVIRRTGAY
jgi:lipopolysaccharide/colanic/teichoic acid biosynthesis glycosyltransferase